MFRRLTDAGAALSSSAQAALNEDTVRLAVTGLSRAGKTVFITSLIHNLLAVPRGHQKALPRLYDDGAAQRIVSASVMPAAAEAVARFPYAENLVAMAATEPNWPPRTADLAQISVKLVLQRKSRRLGTLLANRELTIEILDYPGEWLMDLPLLDKSYAQWSRETIAAAETGARATVSSPFLAMVRGLASEAPADEATAHRAHAAFKDYLHICRERHELQFLQPGRFLCPGPWGDLPLLWFAPLPDVAERPRAGSLASLMATRFEAYKADMKAKFFEPHFDRFHRQIVLVDVLGALHAGQDAFEDTRRAISELAACFHAGSRLSRLFGTSIDRVFFAATKSDHVPAGKRQALQILLRHLAGGAAHEIAGKISRHEFGTIASVRCTRDDVADLAGQSVEVVKGYIIGSDVPKKLFPGDIPLKPPGPEFWSNALFTMPDFQPPKLDAQGIAGIPHIDLDIALEFLLGDKL